MEKEKNEEQQDERLRFQKHSDTNRPPTCYPIPSIPKEKNKKGYKQEGTQKEVRIKKDRKK